jgi:nucleotide-binding universal stress UspA family protein
LTAEPSLLLLRSERLLAIVDPRRGAEILELLDVERARDVLGHPGFAPIDAVAGDLDEETWIRSYRGGWQMIGPNTGHACIVNGDRRGVQGTSSTSPWRVVEAGASTARIVAELAKERDADLIVVGTRGHGLVCRPPARKCHAANAPRGSMPGSRRAAQA